MSNRDDISRFLRDVKAQNVPDVTLIKLLQGRGWPEEDISRALAEEFEASSGLAIPQFKRSGSARDAFLYLLSFSTLATWAIGLGSLLFALIDQSIPDPLSPGIGNGAAQLANSLASVLVAYPIYLASMRSIARNIAGSPEKLDSSIRKWLTYLALLIAAAVLVGYLISFLTSLLRGELTVRFAAKTLSALGIAGGVFWYYLGSLSKGVETHAGPKRDLFALVASSSIATISVVLGFVHLGGPANQRLLQADLSDVRAIQILAQTIQSSRRESTALPADLSSFPQHLRRSPVTGEVFVYHRKANDTYELCSTFRASSTESGSGQATETWVHPKGTHCFQFNALQMVPLPPFTY